MSPGNPSPYISHYLCMIGQICDETHRTSGQRRRIWATMLTYARRYAFTLVGIAGEEDLDAPDLKAPVLPVSAAAKPATGHGRLNGGQGIPGHGDSKVVSHPAKPILDGEASATLRDQLVGELKEIASPDDAAVWAHRILGAENSLTEVDAGQVEDAFQAKLATLDEGSGGYYTRRPVTLSTPEPEGRDPMQARRGYRIGANPTTQGVGERDDGPHSNKPTRRNAW